MKLLKMSPFEWHPPCGWAQLGYSGVSDSASMESILLHIHATLDNRENLKWHRRSMVMVVLHGTIQWMMNVQYSTPPSFQSGHAALELENLDPEWR